MSQVANHQPQLGRSPPQHLGRTAGAVGVAQPVEAEAADAPFPRPAVRYRIGAGLGRQCCVEGRVEYRHLRHAGQLCLRGRQGLQARRVVQRGQIRQRRDARADLRSDPHRRSELAAVDDPVSDGGNFSSPR